MFLSDIRVSNVALVIRIHQTLGSLEHKINRPECGIMFAKSGKLCFDHQGHKYVLDSSHALFVPDKVTYSFTCEEECIAYVINFTTIEPPDVSTFCRFDIGSVNRVLQRLEHLDVLWVFRKPSYELRCIGIIYELLSVLDRVESHYVPSSQFETIEKAISYIEAHYHDCMITNEQLAEISGISEVYFRKLFTERFGISPMAYIKQKKIERAQTLLRSGYATITEVAENVGYGSIYTFSKAFKAATGMSPREYMLTNKDNTRGKKTHTEAKLEILERLSNPENLL